MVLLLLLLASGIRSGYSQPMQRVDKIELNHFYGAEFQHSFDQVIFYEWSPEYCRFHVMQWSLDNGRWQIEKHSDGWTVAKCWSEDKQAWVMARSRLFRETHTVVDPERINKDLLPESKRVGLIR